MTTRHRRRPVRPLAMLALSTTVLTGCLFGGSHGPEPSSHAASELGRGTAGGMPWVLTVSSSPEGNLCMAVNDQLVGSTGPGDGAFVESGCGFGPPDIHLSAPMDDSKAGDTMLVWGPAPTGAVRVRLDSESMAAQTPSDPRALELPGCAATSPTPLWANITGRLPAWAQPGGWFITQAAGAGCGYSDAVFFDAHGKIVPDHRW